MNAKMSAVCLAEPVRSAGRVAAAEQRAALPVGSSGGRWIAISSSARSGHWEYSSRPSCPPIGFSSGASLYRLVGGDVRTERTSRRLWSQRSGAAWGWRRARRSRAPVLRPVARESPPHVPPGSSRWDPASGSRLGRRRRGRFLGCPHRVRARSAASLSAGKDVVPDGQPLVGGDIVQTNHLNPKPGVEQGAQRRQYHPRNNVRSWGTDHRILLFASRRGGSQMPARLAPSRRQSVTASSNYCMMLPKVSRCGRRRRGTHRRHRRHRRSTAIA